MARDRQRAKQRRRRQPAPPPSSAPLARGRATTGLDDASVEESGLHGSTPTPNPLDHASADVDEAALAERGPVGFDDEDETTSSALPTRSRATSCAPPPRLPWIRTSPRSRPRPPAPQRGAAAVCSPSCATAGRSCKRVQWPDRRQVGQATAVVLGFVVIAGGYLGLMDAIWKPLVDAIL